MKTAWQTLADHKLLAWSFIGINLISSLAWAVGLFDPGLHYDKIAHFLLPAVGALLLYVILIDAKLLRTPKRRSGRVLIIVLLASFIGVTWEVYEFWLEVTFPGNTQYGNIDTMMDLIMALLGGTAAGLWHGRRTDKG